MSIDLLPQEVIYRIWYRLEAVDVLNAMQTCRLWYEYAGNDHFWRRLCQRECKTRWRVIVGSMTSSSAVAASSSSSAKRRQLVLSDSEERQGSLSLYGRFWKRWFANSNSDDNLAASSSSSSEDDDRIKVDSDDDNENENDMVDDVQVDDWHRFFVLQTMANRHYSGGVPLHGLMMRQRAGKRKRERKNPNDGGALRKVTARACPLFAGGAGVSPKALIYPMMYDSSSPLTIARLHTGVNGIGSGIGFEIENTEFNLCAMYCFRAEAIKLWRSFFARSDAYIYLVSSQRKHADGLDDARRHLHALFATDKRPNVGPLLVLAMGKQQQKHGKEDDEEKEEREEEEDDDEERDNDDRSVSRHLASFEIMHRLQLHRLPCAEYSVRLIDHKHGFWPSLQQSFRWLNNSLQRLN
jgi:F-box-like